MRTILDVVHLRAGYQAVQVVHDASFTVAHGSITALIGGNGAGKTTVMKTIAGSLPRSGGTVIFKGEDIGDLPPHARVDRGLALVPEGRLIFPQLTVAENLRLGAIVPRAQVGHVARRDEVYDLFPRLRERRTQMGGTLSGGEQQMLALGRGLMSAPELLLLDEPTLGLAPLIVETLFSTIELLRRRGVTILIAEQDTARTLAFADHAYVMENGRIALEGAGRDLLGNAKVREAYLGL